MSFSELVMKDKRKVFYQMSLLYFFTSACYFKYMSHMNVDDAQVHVCYSEMFLSVKYMAIYIHY